MRLKFEPTTDVVKDLADEVVDPRPQEFEKLLKKGIVAAKSGEREEAREMLTQATELEPNNEEAWMWLASVSDYPEELISFLTKVLRINPRNERASKWLTRTESLLKKRVDNGSDRSGTTETHESFVTGTEAHAETQMVDGVSCPFCGSENDSADFHCLACRAVLSLSDIEALLSNPLADRARIYEAVGEMESTWDYTALTESELTALAVGHFNLRNYEKGQEYLRDLLSRDPNNVILAGKLNTIAIRLEEIQHKDELDNAKPKGKSILVVDDSATVRKLISSKLEKSGHSVTCAVDGVDGLEHIAAAMPDIVFLDIAMPRMDGYEVCKQIRANPVSKHLPIVMISGKDGFFDKVRGKMAGASGYVTKPFGPDTLMKALETHLAAKPVAVVE